MTTAERLRNEMVQSASFSKEEFIQTISNRIKNSLSCRASFICDRHISETKIKDGNTIRMSDEPAAIDFARSEGFKVSYDHNCYGVRYIVFTL